MLEDWVVLQVFRAEALDVYEVVAVKVPEDLEADDVVFEVCVHEEFG